jgi:two-component sensor histidine kinase
MLRFFGRLAYPGEIIAMSAQGPASQVWRPEHLRLAIDAARVALWSWHVDSNRFTMDERAFELWGLGDLISVLLAPYDDQGAFAGRIRVAVPRMGVGERTATTLAMVIHELATNAVKHGALSVDAGTLDISGTTNDQDVILMWAESGGPPISGVSEMRGFGSQMISKSIAQQFDGALSYDWQPSGVVVTLRLRKDRLAA